MADKLNTRARSLASKLVDRYGHDATFEVEGTVTYNVSEGEALAEPTKTKVLAKITPPQPYSIRYVDGSTVLDTDVSVLIAARGLSFTPRVNMRVLVDGAWRRVVHVAPVHGGSQVAAYDLQLRL